MRKRKLAKFAAMAHFRNVFQPSYEELLQNGFQLKGKWGKLYFGNNNPVIVELGCGKGEYTVNLAGKFPGKNFIGVDIKGARMYSGALDAGNRGLNNVAFVRTRIENTGFLFGPGEISEIWLTFPDPQMKNTRKRLTSTAFIYRYRKFLRPGGIIHIKTDSRFLYLYTLAMTGLNCFKIVHQTDDLYGSGLLNETLGITTFYEKQWLERSLTVKYLAFIPGDTENLLEPTEEFERDKYRSFGRSARN